MIASFFQVHILGDVRRKNCTAVFYDVLKEYSTTYSFRMECPNTSLMYSFPASVIINFVPGMNGWKDRKLMVPRPDSRDHFLFRKNGVPGKRTRPLFIMFVLEVWVCFYAQPVFLWKNPPSDISLSDGRGDLPSSFMSVFWWLRPPPQTCLLPRCPL